MRFCEQENKINACKEGTTMKILLTSDWYIPAVNGVVTSLLALRRQLTRQGHEVRVLTLSGSLHGHISGGVYALGSVDAGMIYPGARLRAPGRDELLRELIAWVRTSSIPSANSAPLLRPGASPKPAVCRWSTPTTRYTRITPIISPPAAAGARPWCGGSPAASPPGATPCSPPPTRCGTCCWGMMSPARCSPCPPVSMWIGSGWTAGRACGCGTPWASPRTARCCCF